jgi:hypothetical protein
VETIFLFVSQEMCSVLSCLPRIHRHGNVFVNAFPSNGSTCHNTEGSCCDLVQGTKYLLFSLGDVKHMKFDTCTQSPSQGLKPRMKHKWQHYTVTHIQSLEGGAVPSSSISTVRAAETEQDL